MGLWSAIASSLGVGPIKFLRRYTQRRPTEQGVVTYSYEVYRAKTAEEARQFLEKKNVTEGHFYLVVETPEGNWGKDVNGMYKER
jgi:hypothetical protein